jgi:cytochrome c peroxidase
VPGPVRTRAAAGIYAALALAMLPRLLAHGDTRGLEHRITARPAATSAAGLSELARLGRLIFADESLSASGRMSCRTCHVPEHAHASPPADVVSAGGAHLERRGTRNSPSLRYVHLTPAFHVEPDGTAVGGFFRDGRASSLTEQALGPFMDVDEMANPSVQVLAARLEAASYAGAFRRLFGASVFDDPQRVVESAASALAQFQVESREFHPFDSRYDAYLAGETTLTAQQLRGLKLFNDPGKGNCAACHPSEPGADGSPPLFTDFTYDTLGVPRNADIPANADAAFVDLGVCGPRRSDVEGTDLCGAFKVPTLRNVAKTAPYFHNGRFKTLQEVVAFYARRDTNPEEWYPTGPGGVRKFDDLPTGLHGNVNVTEAPYDRKPGDPPALTATEIEDVVAFLQTLDDGYRP